MNTKYIFTEVSNPDFRDYFDGDCFTDESGGYEYNLFIICDDDYHNKGYGLNYDKYIELKKEMDLLANDFEYATEHKNYTYKTAMQENGITYNSTKCSKLKKLFYNYSYSNISLVAQYLTIKTDKHWNIANTHGYCQRDFAYILYCDEVYSNPAMYGELFFGCGKEFSLTEIDENGKETDTVYGYFLPDSQCYPETEIKNNLCSLEGIKPDETTVKLISNTYTVTKYEYKAI